MISILLISLISVFSQAADYTKEIEKDYSLRSLGGLQLINARGNVSVKGWSQDKIRVRVRKLAEADTPEKGQEALTGVDYRYAAVGENIEISSQYGSSLSIDQRLQQKHTPLVKMDMMVFAPASMKLSVWSIRGKVEVAGWNSSVEIRSKNGPIHVEGLKGDSLSVSCSSCTAHINNVRSKVHGRGGSGVWELSHIDSPRVYVETESGGIKSAHVKGTQLYVTQDGDITGNNLRGNVEFRSGTGRVLFRDLLGSLSGFSQSGDISARIKAWKASEKSLIESARGNIDLTFPASFSSDIDLWSIHGSTWVDFPWERVEDPASYGPEPTSHMIGRIRAGGELLKVFSEQGDIRLSRTRL